MGGPPIVSDCGNIDCCPLRAGRHLLEPFMKPWAWHRGGVGTSQLWSWGPPPGALAPGVLSGQVPLGPTQGRQGLKGGTWDLTLSSSLREAARVGLPPHLERRWHRLYQWSLPADYQTLYWYFIFFNDSNSSRPKTNSSGFLETIETFRMLFC